MRYPRAIGSAPSAPKSEDDQEDDQEEDSEDDQEDDHARPAFALRLQLNGDDDGSMTNMTIGPIGPIGDGPAECWRSGEFMHSTTIATTGWRWPCGVLGPGGAL